VLYKEPLLKDTFITKTSVSSQNRTFSYFTVFGVCYCVSLQLQSPNMLWQQKILSVTSEPKFYWIKKKPSFNGVKSPWSSVLHAVCCMLLSQCNSALRLNLALSNQLRYYCRLINVIQAHTSLQGTYFVSTSSMLLIQWHKKLLIEVRYHWSLLWSWFPKGFIFMHQHVTAF
jgi:phosphatidylserine synthase